MSAVDHPTSDPTSSPADAHEVIRVIGARENNLRDVSVEIPKRRLTVFTGVSGSGKSSLVFGTIAADAQRMINETYPAFVQGFMASLPRPDVDHLAGLTAAIIVDQERMGANARSTLGTITDVNTMLRILFSRAGTPRIGSQQAFSFNVATASGKGAVEVERAGAPGAQRLSFAVQGGMCPDCEGMGRADEISTEELLDESLSLDGGAITIPGFKPGGWSVRMYSESGYFDAAKPIREYSDQERHDLLHRETTKVKISGISMSYEGLIPRVRKSFLSKDRESLQPHLRTFVDRAVVSTPCPACGGTRLNEIARSVRLADRSIDEVCAMTIVDLAGWVRSLDLPAVAPLLTGLQETLDAFVEIGLGYLSLDRPSGTLSGGEAQRTKMIRHLGSSLTDITYVFDEPSAGLHPSDVERMNGLLRRLRDKGNTVLVVEHKPEVIRIADHLVDLGPGAGGAGGEICFQGDLAGLLASATATGRHLEDRARLKETVREPDGAIEVRGAEQNNLRGIDVNIPLGVLVAVTGVAGSGKSSLLGHVRAADEDITMIDQAAIRGSRRSNPATYTGLLEPVRKAFAKANGVKPALFSANSEGACPACGGAGMIFTDLAMMGGVGVVCEDCAGQRFQEAVLEYRLGGKNIAEVLAMSTAEALEFFSDGEARIPAAARVLRRLVDVGLSYIGLGQPLTTLSGGERQRLKLAARMADPGGVIILDEPTTGLHLADVDQLLTLLDSLVDQGSSVIVIEHHQAVIAHADWIVDLGPGAGAEGGRVVFQGTPADLVAARSTVTGEHLASYIAD